MPKPTLNKTIILHSALQLASQDGVEKVSFRKLAHRLGVSAMAIYRHFDNKQQLLAAMLDAFIEQSDVLPTTDEISWQQWLDHVATRMYNALQSEPSWLPLLGQLPLQASGLRVMNACLEKLQQSGFTQAQSVDAFFALIQVLFGASIAQQQLNSRAAMQDTNNNESLEFLEAASQEMLRLTLGQQITIGLNILIAGLEKLK